MLPYLKIKASACKIEIPWRRPVPDKWNGLLPRDRKQSLYIKLAVLSNIIFFFTKMRIMRIIKMGRDPMKFKEIVKILRENGWQQKSVKGSHYQYIHPSKLGKITIPCHRGDLDKRTVKSIFTAAGLDTSKLV